jgi:hypothetical protein
MAQALCLNVFGKILDTLVVVLHSPLKGCQSRRANACPLGPFKDLQALRTALSTAELDCAYPRERGASIYRAAESTLLLGISVNRDSGNP